MSDDELFYSPFRKPSPPRTVPRPGELLWEEHHNHHFYRCELRYHGEWGVEAQILRDCELMIGRRFDTKALAVRWAEQERQHRWDDLAGGERVQLKARQRLQCWRTVAREYASER